MFLLCCSYMTTKGDAMSTNKQTIDGNLYPAEAELVGEIYQGAKAKLTDEPGVEVRFSTMQPLNTLLSDVVDFNVIVNENIGESLDALKAKFLERVEARQAERLSIREHRLERGRSTVVVDQALAVSDALRETITSL